MKRSSGIPYHKPRPSTGPAVAAACAFITGIVTGSASGLSPAVWLIAAGVFASTVLIMRRYVFADYLAIILLVLCGASAATVENTLHASLMIDDAIVGETATVTGKIARFDGIRNGSVYFTIACETMKTSQKHNNVTGLLPGVVYDTVTIIPEGSMIEAKGEIIRRRLPVTGKNDLLNKPAKCPFCFAIDPVKGSLTVHSTGNGFFERIAGALSRSADRFSFRGQAPLVKAMTIADTIGMNPEARETFARSGIAHLLAVSGLHAGIVAVAADFFLALFPIGMRKRRIAVILIVALYAGVCGFKPPVTRAALMLALLYGSYVFERPYNPENALFAVLLVILAITPSALFGASLQLSFAAVWSITAFHRPVMAFIVEKCALSPGIFVRRALDLFIVSTAASIGTAAVAACHFDSIPLYGPLVNLIAVPLTSPVVICGFVAIVFGAIGGPFVPVASVAALFAGACAQLLVLIARLTASLPFAAITWRLSPILALAIMAWLFILAKANGGGRVLKKAAVYLPLGVLLVSAWAPIARGENGNAGGERAVFFDVGQGDAVLIAIEGGPRFLIDCGPRFGNYDAGKAVIAPSLDALGIDRLDGIFISHSHSDHTGGLDAILSAVAVERIFCAEDIVDSLKARYGVRVYALAAGDSIAFGKGGMLVLSPPQKGNRIFHDGGGNDSSLVLRIDIDHTRIALTGDIESGVQTLLASWGGRLDADILKVPHHGAAGLKQEFLNAVTPGIAVVSCGKNNRYGHPHNETLSSLEASGCTVYRTDKNGAVVVTMPSLRIESR